MTVLAVAVEFKTAKSRLPSPLKSPATRATGPVPVAGFVPNAVNAPVPSPDRMVMVLSVLFSTARSVKPSPSKSPAATLCGPFPTGTGELLPAIVCCWTVPVLSPAVPNGGKVRLVVSRKDTVPVGAGLALPIPAMVAFSDQPMTDEPLATRLVVVGYKLVGLVNKTVAFSAGVEELLDNEGLNGLKVATMECVPMPPSCLCRTALPAVPLADCIWTVPSTSVTPL